MTTTTTTTTATATEAMATEAEKPTATGKPTADGRNPLPSMATLVVRGALSLRRYWRLFSVLYLVQFTVAALVTWTVSIMLAAVFAEQPIFDLAVAGDLASLVFVLTDDSHVFLAIVWLALGTVMGYALISWYLIGGLNAVLVHAGSGDDKKGEVVKRFGAGGARTFFGYARLFLLSLVPYAIIAALFLFGLSSAADELAYGLSLGDVLSATVPKLLPALVAYLVHTTALDYARIELSRTIGLASRHALWRGYKTVLRDWRPLAHVLLYILAFAAISGVYVLATMGQPMAGAMGAVALFCIRQLVSAARFSAKMVCASGQVAYARALSGDDEGSRKRLPVLG